MRGKANLDEGHLSGGHADVTRPLDILFLHEQVVGHFGQSCTHAVIGVVDTATEAIQAVISVQNILHNNKHVKDEELTKSCIHHQVGTISETPN